MIDSSELCRMFEYWRALAGQKTASADDGLDAAAQDSHDFFGLEST